LKSNSVYRLLTLLGAFALLLCFYGKVVLSPNSYLFSGNGDGVKNYFTYAYHLKNNESLTNFEGFNYPYGENFLYTDGHPILISILQPIQSIFPSVANYSIGILNSLLLLSFLISALVLFRLLRELKINAFLAMLGACATLTLAPQIFRLEGHFALSYSFVIPLCFLWLLQYVGKNRSAKHLIYLTLFHAALLFVHAYLGIISISILVAYFLVDGILNRFQKANSWYILGSSILSMVPFLTVKAYSDFHKFRTDNPYGFFEYYADIDTIILPHHGVLKDYLFSQLPSFTQTWEGWAYLGLGTILLLPFIAFFFFRNFHRPAILPLNKLLLAATLLLIFSFGIPFRFGLENMLEYIPILKQFRSIGRFAWVFYFATSVYAFYLVHFWSEHIRHKFGKLAFILLLPTIMILEGLPYHEEVGNNISQTRNSFNPKNLNTNFSSTLDQIDPTKFQAIVSIPFYNIGSENYEKEASNEVYLNSMLLSYHTGLPLTSSYLTRVSLQESRNAMQFFAPNFYPKLIEPDLNSALPFLVLWNKNDSLQKEEKRLLTTVNWIYQSSAFAIGNLAYDSVFETTVTQELKTFAQDTTLVPSNGFLVSDSSKYFSYQELDERLTEKQFYRTNNYIEINQQVKTKLIEVSSPKLTPSQTYAASVWVSSNSKNAGQDELNHLEFVLEEKATDGTVLQSLRKEVMSTFTHFQGESLVELEFSPTSKGSTFEFYMDGNSPQPNMSYAADFLVRNNGLNVLKVLKGSKVSPSLLFKNNHRIQLTK